MAFTSTVLQAAGELVTSAQLNSALASAIYVTNGLPQVSTNIGPLASVTAGSGLTWHIGPASDAEPDPDPEPEPEPGLRRAMRLA